MFFIDLTAASVPVVHISDPRHDFYLSLYLGDDLQWHAIGHQDVPLELVDILGNVIDRCYT